MPVCAGPDGGLGWRCCARGQGGLGVRHGYRILLVLLVIPKQHSRPLIPIPVNGVRAHDIGTAVNIFNGQTNRDRPFQARQKRPVH